MTWLFSLYWLGAVAAAAPVLFHMWRRIPRGERSFSTLMFLTPSPPRITSRSRIEHWILLLLRAAALLLIAFAFTRPLWRVPFTAPDDLTEEKLLAVLVDTSASMRRQGLWDDLQRRLDQRLEQIPLETSVGLFRFDHHFEPIVDFRELKSLDPVTRRSLVRSRLKELKPTWQDTMLGDALVRAATSLQDEKAGRSHALKQQILVASDFQAGAEIVALQGYEWPEEVSVEFLPLGAVSPSNAGLQVVERHAESLDDALRVRITNSPDSLKQQFALRWDANESPEISVYVPPGQSRVIAPPILPEGVVATTLVLQGDDHEFDNRVYITEALPEKRLVIFSGHESANDVDAARFFLERVLKASRQFQVELKEPQDANLASADSQPTLIVVTEPQPEHQNLIRTHLDQNGTVLIVSPTADAMASSLEMCGFEGIKVTEASVRNYAMLAEIDFDHPLFAPFVESRFSNFTGIRFWKHRTVTDLPAMANHDDKTEAHDPIARVLARFDDSEPAVIEISKQKGTVILFTSGWQPADSQFARSSKFPMLMFRLLEQATGSMMRHDSHTVGDDLPWPVTNRFESTSTGTVRKPNGTEIPSLPLNQPFAHADAPGVYSLIVPGRTTQVAVNLAADESRTAPLTVEQLEVHGLRLSRGDRISEAQIQLDHQHQLHLVELEQTQKLWQKVLFTVILILLVESYASGWFQPKQGFTTEA